MKRKWLVRSFRGLIGHVFASVHLKEVIFLAVILPVVLCMWFSVLGVCSFFIVMKFHLVAGAINVSFFSEIQCNGTYKVLRIARKSSYYDFYTHPNYSRF